MPAPQRCNNQHGDRVTEPTHGLASRGGAGGAAPSQSPLVDVLLATYNGAKYLRAQLDSLLAQTHQNFRLLVSDDGSSDDTPAILESYRVRFGERLVHVPNPHHGQGLVRNFENLMVASLHDGVAAWVAFSDQDDVWLPPKIELCLQEMVQMEQEGGAELPCLVHSDLTVVDEHLGVISESFATYQRMDPLQCSPLSLLSVNQVTGCTMMVNRTLLRMALPLPQETIMHDWWCGLVSGSGHRCFVPTPLILYRQHGANQVGARDRSLKTRLLRLLTNGQGIVRRVRMLGGATYLQAQALQLRLRALGLDEGYVSEYLAWRDGPLRARIFGYREYYVGPELDRLSRCLLWFK
jgi:glycosyltransferase involved in cell wall biosynthesis